MMRIASVVVLVIMAVLMGACKTLHTGKSFSEYDDFDKQGEIGIVVGGLGSSFSSFQATGSSFARLEEGGRLVGHVFQATVMHRDTVLTATRAAFEADGEVFESPVVEVADTYEFTRFRMPLTRLELKKLAEAESIRFRLYSSRGKFPAWEFSKSQRQAAKKYYDEYVVDQP